MQIFILQNEFVIKLAPHYRVSSSFGFQKPKSLKRINVSIQFFFLNVANRLQITGKIFVHIEKNYITQKPNLKIAKISRFQFGRLYFRIDLRYQSNYFYKM